MNKLKELYQKHKEVILYIFYGVLTTLVNLIVYWIFELILGKDLYLVSNTIAWVLAAAFAYVVNKLFVFESKSWAPKIISKEIIEFFGARVFSFGVEELGMLLFVDGFDFKSFAFEILGFTVTGTFIAKVILAVIVIILNYFFSKFFIFKKKKDTDKKSDTAVSQESNATEVADQKEENK
ncbi:MAG: GtrA family protein [Clostridia bacterium]|nr:GtrA family protein [Clostridia bacterium]